VALAALVEAEKHPPVVATGALAQAMKSGSGQLYPAKLIYNDVG